MAESCHVRLNSVRGCCCCFPRHLSRALDHKQGSQDLNPCSSRTPALRVMAQPPVVCPACLNRAECLPSLPGLCLANHVCPSRTGRFRPEPCPFALSLLHFLCDFLLDPWQVTSLLCTSSACLSVYTLLLQPAAVGAGPCVGSWHQ